MVYLTNNAKETENIGYALAKKLDTDGISTAFIALHGEMGVGKTAFVRGFASYFDISGVRSPTYTVVNEYCGRASIYHFDMYRIDGEDDLYSVGYDDYIKKRGYCLAEWSENVQDFLPDCCISVAISRTDGGENERKIEITE